MNNLKFSPEIKERPVRMVLDQRDQCGSQWAAVESIADKIGCVPQTLSLWIKRRKVDSGFKPGVTSSEKERITALEREKSVYWRRTACQRNPQMRCKRAKSVEAMIPQIERVWQRNLQVCGANKVWHQLNREGVCVSQCTALRLMRRLGLRGVRRGKVIRTTVPDPRRLCPLDHVNRVFKAQRANQLWVSDFTYVSTWQGWLYVAFVIDVFARRIVGWQVGNSMHTDFVLDALEQALFARQPAQKDKLIHHRDRGSQYVSIRYSARLSQAGIEPSVGSVGDSYDNALAETINGLYKAELIHRKGPRKTKASLEMATLEWVSWFKNQRLLASLGYIPLAEAKANYYLNLKQNPMQPVSLEPNSLR